MRILLCVRQDYYRNFAADSMQVLKIAKYLRKKGAVVDINNGGTIDYSEYDIVHLFSLNSTGEMYKYYKIAHHYKSNIVISPNYWNLKKYYEHKNDFESMKLWDRCKPYRNEILKRSKMIFCNSEIEKRLIKEEFINLSTCKVIHYGVEVENEDVPLYNFRERYLLNNYILCVGRISESKNQLTLSKICNGMGVQLVLMGNVLDRSYFKECMKYKNVKYFGFMDSYNIYNAYRFAKLHVLASFAEMPGLSSLEAAASGSNIISTKEGCAFEYFKEMAIYCDPYDEESIKEAIEKGYKKRKSNKLKKYTLANYNWKKFTDELYRCYEDIIKRY